MATEQDAARDRVLAARADLAEQLDRLEASGRAAVDIPARIKRSPGKVAAVAGGIGFLALKGPQRLVGRARRIVRGKAEPLPAAMLPPEIEKTLKRLGSDGDKVRGALERDFAAYAKQSQKSRDNLRTVLLLSAARPLITRGSKAVAEMLFTPDAKNFGERLEEIRARAERTAAQARGAAAPDGPDAVEGAAGDDPPGGTLAADR